jgi:L-ascorbate metabolism protein UlaG (beta-lactamase superfamily)
MATTAKTYETDQFDAGGRPLRLTSLGHSTLMWEWEGLVIHMDPWTAQGDYSALPRADVILVTHEHQDHLDPAAIALARKPGTRIVVNPAVKTIFGEGEALANREKIDLGTFTVEAVPAYNITPGREKFHPKGRDNGYLLTFGPLRILVAGDTEDHSELKAFRNIDVAFLPMNQPYTMTPDQAASVARAIRPRVLYPYHFGETDPQALATLLGEEKGIEVRIRRLA